MDARQGGRKLQGWETELLNKMARDLKEHAESEYARRGAPTAAPPRYHRSSSLTTIMARLLHIARQTNRLEPPRR